MGDEGYLFLPQRPSHLTHAEEVNFNVFRFLVLILKKVRGYIFLSN